MTLFKTREQKIKQMEEGVHSKMGDLLTRIKRGEKIEEGDTTSAALVDSGWEQKITLSTLEDLQAIDEPELAILASSPRPHASAGSMYTFTGMKGDGQQWWDHNNQYVVGPEDIRLPATVIFIPAEPQEAWQS